MTTATALNIQKDMGKWHFWEHESMGMAFLS